MATHHIDILRQSLQTLPEIAKNRADAVETARRKYRHDMRSAEKTRDDAIANCESTFTSATQSADAQKRRQNKLATEERDQSLATAESLHSKAQATARSRRDAESVAAKRTLEADERRLREACQEAENAATSQKEKTRRDLKSRRDSDLATCRAQRDEMVEAAEHKKRETQTAARDQRDSALKPLQRSRDCKKQAARDTCDKAIRDAESEADRKKRNAEKALDDKVKSATVTETQSVSKRRSELRISDFETATSKVQLAQGQAKARGRSVARMQRIIEEHTVSAYRERNPKRSQGLSAFLAKRRISSESASPVEVHEPSDSVEEAIAALRHLEQYPSHLLVLTEIVGCFLAPLTIAFLLGITSQTASAWTVFVLSSLFVVELAVSCVVRQRMIRAIASSAVTFIAIRDQLQSELTSRLSQLTKVTSEAEKVRTSDTDAANSAFEKELEQAARECTRLAQSARTSRQKTTEEADQEYTSAREPIDDTYTQLTASALEDCRDAVATAENECNTISAEIRKTYEKGVSEAESQYALATREARETRSQAQDVATDESEKRNRDLSKDCNEATSEAAKIFSESTAEAHRSYEESVDRVNRDHVDAVSAAELNRKEELQRISEQFKTASGQIEAAIDVSLTEIEQGWKESYASLRDDVQDVELATRTLVTRPSKEQHDIPADIPGVLRFGRLGVDLKEIPHVLSTEERFSVANSPIGDFPALVPFPDAPSLLFECKDEGKKEAVACIHTLMLTLLTELPPGKVRFTILDPLTSGDDFAKFMQLTDYDEQLVTTRIWTESRHINKQLEKLDEHTTLVNLKYLRGQFDTLEHYNAEAGEVAEPYRFLVVNDFPAKFTSDAANRLLSIARGGARCGVYVFVVLDEAQEPVRDFNTSELERHCQCLKWNGATFDWADDAFGRWPVAVEAPPKTDHFISLLRDAGSAAKDGQRVEVPFAFAAPENGKMWTYSSEEKISIPLGKAGATKSQELTLGVGTAHHALIVGKIGSGKSTLLHAIITNVSLHYAPQEIELYLIDFKKGVEFKCYADISLPHAKAIAIESEREFGISILERVYAEMNRRGDLIRNAGKHDIQGYRSTGEMLPRILLIVDEFHNFFAEEDRLCRTAEQCLEKLVREGRAFGIHVILGSQTLAGRNGLSSSILGQISVRIALTCSEADSRLILDKDNPQARLLSRQGEAIYNASNGLEEGNNRFQVVWLSDDERELHLQAIRAAAIENECEPPNTVVFEGNADADASRNVELSDELASPLVGEERGKCRSWRAWLGEPIAIKRPTLAAFRPQAGSNLLIVGRAEKTRVGLLSISIVSLASQLRRLKLTWGGIDPFVILDGTSVDSEHYEVLSNTASSLSVGVQLCRRREEESALSHIVETIQRRVEADMSSCSPVFVLVNNLQLLRDLRRPEDSYRDHRGPDDATPAWKLLTEIIREGPAVSVFTIVSIDTVTNFNRFFDRTSLREFEMRVAMHMSESDSNLLVDSNACAKLGDNRAYFYHDESSDIEKFRPYGPPSSTWLVSVRDQLSVSAAEKPQV